MLVQIRPGLWISARWLRGVYPDPSGGCVVMDGAGQGHSVAREHEGFRAVVEAARRRMGMGTCAVAVRIQAGHIAATDVHAIRADDGRILVDGLIGPCLREAVTSPAQARDRADQLAAAFNERAFPRIEVI